MQQPMSWRDHFRATIVLSLPLIVGQVAMIAIWTADIIMLGWISTDALAAGIQANRLYQPFYFIALGLTIAVSPLAAQALGAGSRRQARRVIRQGIWLAILYGAISFVPMWYGETLLLMLGQEESIARDAAPFLKMLAPGMMPTFVYFALRNYISAYKKPGPPVIVTMVGAAFNVAMNAILSKGLFGMPAMGMAGIGLATSMTFLFMAAALIHYMNTFRPFRYTRPFARFWRIDISIMKRLLVVGTPIAFTLVSETGMFIFAGLYIGIFGTYAVAASGIVNQIAAIVFMVPLAIGQASTIRVGHEAGAGRRQDTIRAGVTPVVLTISVCLVQSVLIIGFAEASIRAFLNPDDASIYAVVMLAMPMLMVVAFFQVFDGLQVVLSCVLRGLNDTKIPAVISIMAYWGVGATMAVALSTPLGFGPVGVWWGLLLGLVAGSIMLGWRGVLTYWRITRGKRLLMA